MKGATYKKPSEYTATRTLERFFSKTPSKNSITKQEIFEAWERDKPEFEKTNEGWLSNKLTAIYAHGLARPIYSFNPWRQLERLELTPKGKKVLGRDDAPVVVSANNGNGSETDEQRHVGELTIDDLIIASEKINERFKKNNIKRRVKITLEEVS